MRLPVTFDEVEQCISRLHLAVPKFGLTTETFPQTVRVYREVLESFDGECVKGSVVLMLKTITKFPTPSTWREACKEWLKHNRVFLERQPETDINGNDIVCPVCRSVARWAVLRMVPSQFSAPQIALRLGCDELGQTTRRIAVCDPSRHRTPHGINPPPGNFVRWVD